MEGHRGGSLSLLLLLPVLVYAPRALLLRRHQLLVLVLVVKRTASRVLRSRIDDGRHHFFGFLLLHSHQHQLPVHIASTIDCSEPVCKLAPLVHKIIFLEGCASQVVGRSSGSGGPPRRCLLLLGEAVHDLCLDLLDEVLGPQNRVLVDDFRDTVVAIGTAMRLWTLT